MNKPTSDWLVLIRSLVAGFDSTRDSYRHCILAQPRSLHILAAAFWGIAAGYPFPSQTLFRVENVEQKWNREVI